MESSTNKVITEMAANLAVLAVKGTATAVHGKIQSIKAEKNIDTIRTTYDEIINQLLSEREDAIRIAQAYKEELDKVTISDEDIVHLHNTVDKILTIMKIKTPNSDNINSYEELNELISVDTLKTMQLIGFNYKSAIGEPLTEICANAIKNWGKSSKNNQKKK